MTQVINFISAKASSWPLKPAGLDDAVCMLSDALGPEWAIEQVINCDGGLTIIVSSSRDPDDMPTFVLFEQSNGICLGTLEHDEWRTDRSLQSLLCAVTALIAKAAVASKRDHSIARV